MTPSEITRHHYSLHLKARKHLACLGEGKPGLLWQEVSGLYGQDHRECCWQIYFDNLAQQSAGLRALTGELRPSRASHLTY